VQDYIIVIGIVLVLVPVPTRGLQVQLHTTRQYRIVDFNFCFQEIWSLVGIELAGMNDLQGFPRFCLQLVQVKILELPDEL
jgi:hypothetical protein